LLVLLECLANLALIALIQASTLRDFLVKTADQRTHFLPEEFGRFLDPAAGMLEILVPARLKGGYNEALGRRQQGSQSRSVTHFLSADWRHSRESPHADGALRTRAKNIAQ
jgi:hypothetical protein